MFGAVAYLQLRASNFRYPDLLLLNARRVQAFFQQQDFSMAFDASELLLRFDQSCGGPAGATDFLRANVLRFAPPVRPLTSTIRSTPPRSAFDRSITTRYRRFRSSPRSTRSSNSGLPAFALVVVPAGFSAHPIPHNPAAFPQRTQPAVGFGRCGGPTRRVTSFSRMALRICSPACPVSSALASPPTPRRSATAPATSTLAR